MFCLCTAFLPNNFTESTEDSNVKVDKSSCVKRPLAAEAHLTSYQNAYGIEKVLLTLIGIFFTFATTKITSYSSHDAFGACSIRRVLSIGGWQHRILRERLALPKHAWNEILPLESSQHEQSSYRNLGHHPHLLLWRGRLIRY
ncbi:hypothetical protein PGTUg99_015988 [Puccinia graminis f. sp. tritici]|uniref:Uncharacterized protein n=1 Tax=Puccinia graminis f. sp. tritici TaxID=56615 RepID=A0A5B0Q4C5_PUCGR|nr:hypothetical protein PGTUg99_015988 [Puccinia graminis f. sp. tritici]